MPEKSIREMNEWEKMHYSLAARTFHASLMSSFILGLVAMIIGLSLYTLALVNSFIRESFMLSRNAAAILERTVDVKSYADKVMEVYRSQSAEEMNQIGTETYIDRFAQFMDTNDYKTINAVLKIFGQSSDMDAIYLAMYDRDTCAIVYLVDPDQKNMLKPGEWETVSEKGMEKFLRWNGKGSLYDIDKTELYGWLCTSGVPIMGSDGKIAAFVLTDVSLGSIAKNMNSFVIQYSLAIAVVTLLIGYLLSQRIKKSLVAPINEIADASLLYMLDRKQGKPGYDHFTNLNIKTGDEVENLSLIIADMAKDISDYEENLTKITAEKERISMELSLATRIQGDMLPNIFPAFPEKKEFDIYASMDPAREVGGDFYDFFLVDDDHLCLVMADVSGKGIPAALFMMASKIILANNAMSGYSPAKILEKTNMTICSNNREEMFVTVWIGILELSTGKLTAANAGHEYPVLKHPDGQFALYKDKHGFVLGGMDGMKYKEYEIQMLPGSKLFLYTDGVPEATDKDNNMFGTDRMLASLNKNPDGDAYDIMVTMRTDIDAFVKEALQFDDLTMMCLEYKGKKDD